MRVVRAMAGVVLSAALLSGCGEAVGGTADDPADDPAGVATDDAADDAAEGTTDAPDAGTTGDLSSIPDAEDDDGPGGRPDNTTATDDGPVTWGSWQVVGEIEVGKDSIDDFRLAFDVENVGDATTWGRFNVRFTKDGVWVGTGFCTTYDTAPGATTEALCTSSDDYTEDYTEITVWDAV